MKYIGNFIVTIFGIALVVGFFNALINPSSSSVKSDTQQIETYTPASSYMASNSYSTPPQTYYVESSAPTPDDAEDEGYDDGYEQGREDGLNGNDNGYGYDDATDYYNYYETRYQEGYEEGYDEGYYSGYSEYELNEEYGENDY